MTRIIRMTEEDYVTGSENGVGVCLACGTQTDRVEPDARGYKCDSCGEPAVYGLEAALVMDRIEFTEVQKTERKPPTPLALNDRGFVLPNASVVLHRLLSVLYRDGRDTEWNSDTWQAIADILADAGLTYEQWPDEE